MTVLVQKNIIFLFAKVELLIQSLSNHMQYVSEATFSKLLSWDTIEFYHFFNGLEILLAFELFYSLHKCSLAFEPKIFRRVILGFNRGI